MGEAAPGVGYAALLAQNGQAPLYHELQDAWRSLATTLATTLAGDDTSFVSAPSVLEAYSSLLARDALYQHRLGFWADDETLPENIRSGVQAELDAYRARTAPWRDLLDTWLARSESATDGSLDGFWYWLTDFYSRWQLDGLREAILAADVASDIDPILGNALLPHSQTRLAVPLQWPESPVTPVYARGTDLESTSDDLAADPLAPLSDVILQKAEALDHDPVRILNFVQQHVSTRWYVGAMQGAERTLELGAGNDVDGAALLVSLLRASSIPARYETGVVRLQSSFLQRVTGIAEPAAQMRFLQRHGRALEAVTIDGQIRAFDVEYTWVAALVPYANYRGADVDKSGRIWVPLMPVASAVQAVTPFDFLAAAEINAAELVAEYQASDGEQVPVEWLSARVEASLGVDDRERLLLDEPVGSSATVEAAFLPASLPLEVRAVADEGPTIPDHLQHKVNVRLAGGSGETLIDTTLLLAEVDGQRLTMSYMPATRDIQNTVNQFGGLYTTPAWLVSVRPQLRLNGERVAVGLGAVPLGAFHDVTLTFSAPYGEQSVQRAWMAGGYFALSIVAQGLERNPDYSQRAVGDTEFTGARLLSQLAARYNRTWLNDENHLAALTGYKLARPWPRMTIAANGYQREYVLDRLQSLQWESVTLDAALHVTEPVPTSGNASLASNDWTRFNALQGSWREADIFTRLFGVDAISADRGMRLAIGGGAQVLSLAPGDDASILSLPANVVADINRWLERGFSVDVPTTEISYRDWQGAVWTVLDPETGSSGYFISGGLAGGSTVQQDWPLDDYQNAMILMYNDPHDDSASVGQIRKLGNADFQLKGPGEEGERIIVQVLDTMNNPIAGVGVNFSVLAGDAQLARPVAVTDPFGIASVGVNFGTRVDAGALNYRRLSSGDTYPTIVGTSLVEAWVTDYDRGIVRTHEPFRLQLKPGEASVVHSQAIFPELRQNNGGLIEGIIGYLVADEHGNAVANADVRMEYTYSGGDPEFQPGGLVEYDDSAISILSAFDAVPSVSHESISNGAASTSYVNGNGSAEQKVSIFLNGEAGPVKVYPGGTPPSHINIVGTVRNDHVTRVGERMKSRKFAILAWPQRDWAVNSDGKIYLLNTLKEMIPAEPGPDLRFVSNYMDITYEYQGNGVYELFVTGRAVPGVDNIGVNGHVRFHSPAYKEDEPGEDGVRDYVERDVELPLSQLFHLVGGRVWVVDPKVTGLESPSVEAPGSLNLGSGSPNTYTDLIANVLTSLMPAGASFDGHVELRRGSNVIASQPVLPGGQTVLQNGLPININDQYSLVYLLKGGMIESDPVPVSLFQPVFAYPRDGASFVSEINIDPGSDWSCTNGARIGFTLNHRATVTATVGGNEVISGEMLEPGHHKLDYNPQPGVTDYSITAVSGLDGHVETRTGKAVTALEYNPLPIGNTLVEGVNIHNGNLSINRVDFQLGGRGPGMELSRFYNLNGASDPAPLGLGWGHSYNGSVQELGCGAYQVAGGLGGGGRFYLQGDEFVPAKGYHGTLKKDDTENTFDFYTKDGTRYHYRRYSFNNNRTWSLAYIEDTNGNQVLLDYDQSDGKGKLLSVTDSAGRMLSFEYNGEYAGDGEQVALVGSVTGPEGYRVDYAYDEDDRLVSVTTHNNGNDQVEIYTYPEVDGEYEDIYEYYERHTLQSITDPLGYTTSYTYLRLPFNHVVGAVPNLAVDTIVRTTAQNGSVSMDFDYSDRGNAGSGITTDVNNFRGDTVHYVMDGGGRLLSQSLPDIRYEWYTNDILLKRRTQTYQGGEISTAYTYDEHGNITSETLNGRPPITRTWYPPDTFENGAVKNRLKSETGRNGHTTEYTYDDRGNLTEIRYPEDASERYTYASNGDRVSSRDGNGNTVNYSYDDNGYVIRADASDCCDSTFGWNDLGYKTLSSDGRGRVTRYANDRLGRVLEINYPEGVSESFSYDAAGNRTDHYNRRGTHIVYEYDEAGRVVAETWPTTGSRAMRYDPHGNLVESTDFRGVTTYHEYDVRDHLVRSSTAGDDVTRTSLFVVDEQGNVVREDHGEGRVTERVFNDLGLPEEITDANGQASYRSYDHVGNLVSTTDRRGHQATYQYDGRNRLVRQDEPLGRILRWTYDANGNVASETDANGNVTERDWTQHGKPRSVAVRNASGSTLSSRLYRYDAAGNLEEESNSRGAVTAYAYDDLNRLIRVDRPAPLGDLRYTAYDGNGNVEREVWPNGNVIERAWDERDRLLGESDSLGARRALTYDNNGNVLTETDARGTTVTRTWTSFNQVKTESLPQHGEGDLLVSYAYDSQGNLRFRRVNDTLSGLPEMTWETRYDVLNRPTDEIDPLNRVQVTVYDAEGNPERVTNRRNNVTTYSYDALNRLQQVNEPLGRQRVLGYDAHGNLTSELDGRGFVTRYTYDGLHRRIETARNDLVILRENYDGEGNLLKRIDANGNATSYEYLDANLLSQETGEEAVVTRYGYDAMGNRISRIDPENHTTRWTYDARQRVESEQNALNETTQFEYDGNGNRTARITPKGYRWQYDWTLGNLLASVDDPEGGSTDYTYDGRGNRLSVTDANNNVTRWDYDVLARPTQMFYPDGRVHRWLEYDGNDNLLAERDPRGLLIEHDYDDLDRASARRFHDANEQVTLTEGYLYDLNNNLTEVSETRSAQRWTTTSTYDDFDRLTHQVDRFGQKVTYSYDKNGNRTRLISSAGHATEYRYDRRNRVTAVVNVEGENRYSYNRNSLLKRIHYASGATADYSYDAASRITALSNQHNGAVVSSYSYRYDANGNRLEQTEQNGFGEESTTYVYDRADRLTEVVYPDQHDTYTYDPAWNRVTEIVADSQGTLLSSKVLGYNSRNQLTDITDSVDAANNATFGYDEIGNQVTKVKDGITTRYVYDARNHLREVTTGGSTVGQFLYDYRGLRTEKQGDRGTERYSYDDQSVLFQSDASNAPTAKYEYGPNRLLSLKQTGLASEFYLFDALRSPVTLVRKDGSISARYAYNAWGEKRHESGDSFNRFGFTGHEHDTETGLIYAKARYYDPDTARFLSQDPFAGIPDMPPSLHKYLYAYQNPTVFVDPDGRLAALEVAVVAGVVYLGVTVLTLETNNQLQKGMSPSHNRTSTAPLMSVPPSYQGDTDIGSIPDVSVIALIKGAYVLASELFVAEDETGVGTTVTPMRDPIPAPEGYPADDLGLPISTAGDQVYDQGAEDYIYSQPYQDERGGWSTSYPDHSEEISKSAYLSENKGAYQYGDAARKLRERADGYTSPEIKNARQRGVRRAKAEERALIQAGHEGTADEGWSFEERKLIAEEGQYPADVRWHHINDVKRNPEMASEPDNVIPSRGGTSGHVKKHHPQGTRAGSSGDPVNRKELLDKHIGGQ